MTTQAYIFYTYTSAVKAVVAGTAGTAIWPYQ